MHGANGRHGAFLAGVVAIALALSACGAPGPEATAVPTFTVPSAAAAPGAAPDGADGAIPRDCAEILPVSDLEALLGLPIASVGVRTTIGVAEPSVGRTGRVACRYSGTPGGPARGRPLLDVNVSAYTDQNAATAQWRINSDAEEGDRREMPIGTASAVLVERSGEAVLMVVYGAGNLTVVLPARPLPGDRPPGDLLVDLALRVLPAIAGVATASAPVSPPAQRVGASS